MSYLEEGVTLNTYGAKMNPIQRGEKCQVEDEKGKCQNQATMFFFGEGRRVELHVCDIHYPQVLERAIQTLTPKRKQTHD